MKEITDILMAYERAEREGKRCALATVVQVEGSSYRRPGARMLVTEDGCLTGAISGGCLEGDALRKALFAIQQQTNKLVTYDTSNEDDLRFGVQLGCNGIVRILFEPVRDGNPIRLLREATRERREAVLVTLFSRQHSAEQIGTSLLYTGGLVTTTLTGPLREAIVNNTLLNGGGSHFTRYGPHDAFIEFLSPPPSLVVAGAGNDVLPLVETASLLGWRLTIVDGRPHYAEKARFPKAERVIIAKPHEVLPRLDHDPQHFFLLMTHNYQYDLALLKELLPHRFPYIGVLGPRSKLDRMLGEVGYPLDESQRAAIHGPIGLDIGAETAAEIAVSIVAEIKAFLSGHGGHPLRENTQPIHYRPWIA